MAPIARTAAFRVQGFTLTAWERGCWFRAAVADPAECLDRGLVSVRERVQVPLSRHDRRVAEALLHDLQVGSAGEQPRRM